MKLFILPLSLDIFKDLCASLFCYPSFLNTLGFKLNSYNNIYVSSRHKYGPLLLFFDTACCGTFLDKCVCVRKEEKP
jgi:hypothetical protein